MRGPILFFLLLVLGVFFNLPPDAIYKRGRFSKTLLEKNLKFISSERNDPISFNLRLVLLPTKVDPISEEQGCERDAFVICGINRLEMILALLAEVTKFHMQVSIIEVGVFGLKESIARHGVCLDTNDPVGIDENSGLTILLASDE